jgi:hypothetical protein
MINMENNKNHYYAFLILLLLLMWVFKFNEMTWNNFMLLLALTELRNNSERICQHLGNVLYSIRCLFCGQILLRSLI